jgi:hypothetical protein
MTIGDFAAKGTVFSRASNGTLVLTGLAMWSLGLDPFFLPVKKPSEPLPGTAC